MKSLGSDHSGVDLTGLNRVSMSNSDSNQPPGVKIITFALLKGLGLTIALGVILFLVAPGIFSLSIWSVLFLGLSSVVSTGLFGLIFAIKQLFKKYALNSQQAHDQLELRCRGLTYTDDKGNELLVVSGQAVETDHDVSFIAPKPVQGFTVGEHSKSTQVKSGIMVQWHQLAKDFRTYECRNVEKEEKSRERSIRDQERSECIQLSLTRRDQTRTDSSSHRHQWYQDQKERYQHKQEERFNQIRSLMESKGFKLTFVFLIMILLTITAVLMPVSGVSISLFVVSAVSLVGFLMYRGTQAFDQSKDASEDKSVFTLWADRFNTIHGFFDKCRDFDWFPHHEWLDSFNQIGGLIHEDIKGLTIQKDISASLEKMIESYQENLKQWNRDRGFNVLFCMSIAVGWGCLVIPMSPLLSIVGLCASVGIGCSYLVYRIFFFKYNDEKDQTQRSSSGEGDASFAVEDPKQTYTLASASFKALQNTFSSGKEKVLMTLRSMPEWNQPKWIEDVMFNDFKATFEDRSKMKDLVSDIFKNLKKTAESFSQQLANRFNIKTTLTMMSCVLIGITVTSAVAFNAGLIPFSILTSAVIVSRIVFQPVGENPDDQGSDDENVKRTQMDSVKSMFGFYQKMYTFLEKCFQFFLEDIQISKISKDVKEKAIEQWKWFLDQKKGLSDFVEHQSLFKDDFLKNEMRHIQSGLSKVYTFFEELISRPQWDILKWVSFKESRNDMEKTIQPFLTQCSNLVSASFQALSSFNHLKGDDASIKGMLSACVLLLASTSYVLMPMTGVGGAIMLSSMLISAISLVVLSDWPQSLWSALKNRLSDFNNTQLVADLNEKIDSINESVHALEHDLNHDGNQRSDDFDRLYAQTTIAFYQLKKLWCYIRFPLYGLVVKLRRLLKNILYFIFIDFLYGFMESVLLELVLIKSLKPMVEQLKNAIKLGFGLIGWGFGGVFQRSVWLLSGCLEPFVSLLRGIVMSFFKLLVTVYNLGVLIVGGIALFLTAVLIPVASMMKNTGVLIMDALLIGIGMPLIFIGSQILTVLYFLWASCVVPIIKVCASSLVAILMLSIGYPLYTLGFIGVQSLIFIRNLMLDVYFQLMQPFKTFLVLCGKTVLSVIEVLGFVLREAGWKVSLYVIQALDWLIKGGINLVQIIRESVVYVLGVLGRAAYACIVGLMTLIALSCQFLIECSKVAISILKDTWDSLITPIVNIAAILGCCVLQLMTQLMSLITATVSKLLNGLIVRFLGSILLNVVYAGIKALEFLVRVSFKGLCFLAEAVSILVQTCVFEPVILIFAVLRDTCQYIIMPCVQMMMQLASSIGLVFISVLELISPVWHAVGQWIMEGCIKGVNGIISLGYKVSDACEDAYQRVGYQFEDYSIAEGLARGYCYHLLEVGRMGDADDQYYGPEHRRSESLNDKSLNAASPCPHLDQTELLKDKKIGRSGKL